jgi:hypothetical protein
MGERSRIIGEYGEKTVENFLKLVCWGDVPRNIEFECVRNQRHEKQTHGLDFYFAYKSPLIDGMLKSISISVKFTSEPYPNSPNSIFKKHFEDLVYSMECFKYSIERKQIINGLKGYNQIDETGVLFWLSNSMETYNSLISKVSNVNLKDDYIFDSVYLVDNHRIDFIFHSISFARNYYSEQSEVLFYYPDTGKNIIPSEKHNCGKILPVEYINASIIPLRVEELLTKQVTLMLFTIDPFSKTDLTRLIALAQDLSKSWAGKITIAFPDYNELSHSHEVRIAKNAFENNLITHNLQVVSYKNDFKSLQTI